MQYTQQMPRTAPVPMRKKQFALLHPLSAMYHSTRTKYRFIAEVPHESTIVEYELTWLPKGFYFQKEQDLDGGTYLTYTDYAEIRSIQIGNIHADFYQANEEVSSNMLVWTSEEDDLAFYIIADPSENTMIKLTEGVQKNLNTTVQNDLLHSFTGYKQIKEVIPLKKSIFPNPVYISYGILLHCLCNIS